MVSKIDDKDIYKILEPVLTKTLSVTVPGL